MDGEEHDLLGAMHRLFSDDELLGVEGTIVGKIDRAPMMGFLSLIVPALDRPERAGMLSAMRAAMPADVAAVETALGLQNAA